MTIEAPVPIAGHDLLDPFDSGVAALDDWLRRRARANQEAGASRTYVACDGDRVVGYYALASGSVATKAAPGRFRRNMPEPTPVVVLGRLAIDRAFQGRGLGLALMRDAGERVLQAADVIGIRGLLVNAKSEEARSFYLALDFEPSPLDPMMLLATMGDLRRSAGS